MNRGAKEVVVADGFQKPKTDVEVSPVTFASVDAPKGAYLKPDFGYFDVSVAEDRITVKVFDEDGNPIDRFSVDRAGKVTEEKR